MRHSLLFSLLLLFAGLASAQAPAPKDIDITTRDGTKLRATFFAAAKLGPGVVLLHMCNTTRKSWEPVAKGLSERGINVLTIDNRGFGESGGPRFDGGSPEVRQELNEKWPADFDAAYQFLTAQSGVDKGRLAFGGGSCGVGNAVSLAERHADVKALVLLAGTTDVKGINFLADHPERPIFTAAAADDEYNDDAASHAVDGRSVGRSANKVFWVQGWKAWNRDLRAASRISAADRCLLRRHAGDKAGGSESDRRFP
jgi:alpha-beta hydrolase superfamily lysophospholipase